MKPAAPGPNDVGHSPSDDRLDSWKEIAAFLHRDVRTVQRWEKHAGLPIHRHLDSRLRSAYAYRSELDEWWRAKGTVVGEQRTAEAADGRAGLRGGRALVALALVVVALAAVIGFALSMWRASAPPGARVDVLISGVVDETGDRALAAMVDDRIGIALARQSGLAIVPPARVARMLRLMRVERPSPLPLPIARELAVRDGAIASVISARLHKVDAEYLVDLQAIDPADGSVRLSVEPRAVRGEIMPRVEAETKRFAAALAAMSPTPARREVLEPVTTTSLPALRLYTSAAQAVRQRQWAAAEQLAQRAIAADDRFASAYALVGRAMRNQGRPRRECLPWLERAVALSSSVSDRESYAIAGAYHSVAGHLAEAIGAYQALLRLQPDNAQAADQLVALYSRAGRVQEAIELSVARAAQSPDDFYANVRAAHALMIWKGDRARAEPYVQRARRLVSARTADDRPVWTAWLGAVPAFDAWMNRDRRGALDALEGLERTLDSRLGRERDALATRIGSAYLVLGRPEQAEHAFRRAASPQRQVNLALAALAQGDLRRARRWLRQVADSSSVGPALFASTGLTAEAENGLLRLPPSDHEEGIAEITRGLLAARTARDRDAAAAALRRGVERMQFSGEPEYFLGVAALAGLLAARGELDSAVDWLAQAAARRERTYASSHWTGACWLQINAQLASVYRTLGQREKADQIDASLSTLLPEGDHKGAAGTLLDLARRR